MILQTLSNILIRKHIFYSFIKTATVVPYNLQTVYDCLIALVNSPVFPVSILWDVWKLGIWKTKHQIDRWDWNSNWQV